MVSRDLVIPAVKSRVSTQLLHSIVNECFIKALPVNTTEMTAEESSDLNSYSWAIVNSIGGISALESSVDFVNKTPRQNLFLGELYDFCMEGAKIASNKVKDSYKDPSATLNSILDKSSLTDEEYKSLTKKKGNLNIDKIAKVIKDKTVAVIKDEQKQYEKEKKLDDEIDKCLDSQRKKEKKEKENSNPMKDEGGTDIAGNSSEDVNMEEISSATEDLDADGESAKEAFFDVCLGKLDPRHHITVFSRLQESAMESMKSIKVRNEEDYIPIIKMVTFESFLPTIGVSALESSSTKKAIEGIAKEEVCEVPEANKPKMATLVSIIVYTMMETLKTMGLISPNQDSIRKFVTKPFSTDECALTNASERYNTAKKVVKEAAMLDFSKLDNHRLSDELVKLQTANESFDKLFHENSNNMTTVDLVAESNRYIENIKGVLQQRDMDLKKKMTAIESYATTMQKSNDVAQFNRMHTLFGRNPNVDEIVLMVDPNNIASVIDVKCVAESGTTVGVSFMNMQYACESSTYLKYLKDTFEKSKLMSSNKKVSIYVNDGKGQKINLK